MIESINIQQIATYGATPEVLGGLSKFNFLFGSNGSGKTTIARVIEKEDASPTCSVVWRGGTKLQTMVYSRDFVEENFSPSTELKGIFTLGKENVETLKKIAAAKDEFDSLTTRIEELSLALGGDDGTGGKQGDLATLDSEFKDLCWAQKQKHDAKFAGAFSGFRSSAEKFKTKVLTERDANSADAVPLADLEQKAATVFGKTPMVEKSIPVIEFAGLLADEADPILSLRVMGKEDVDIASLIKRLENSDWVQEGREFLDVSEGICPFCQQKIPENLKRDLSDYFDEAFEAHTQSIARIEADYKSNAERVQRKIGEILDTPGEFLDAKKLEGQKALLDTKIAVNIQVLARKRKEPSVSVELESLSGVLTATQAVIDAANNEVTNHNTMVANLEQEKHDLTAQVWRHLLDEELKGPLSAYDTKRAGLQKAIDSMAASIESANNDREVKAADIQRYERDTTSIQPTIDGINALLKSFGFQSFALALADTERFYKLVRPDGTDAKQTLSEGERSFVAFLYFYHLLKGSNSESGMTADRVVVFDDPVSSLDSDVLFIVSSLIKGLFDEVRAEEGHIKQIFVLTHNVYFHREITFNQRRGRGAPKDETFWTVRKSSVGSKIDGHDSNPIKSSYDLLWAEVRNPDRTSLTIQNTLRRILESYFKMFGGIEPKDLVEGFEGKEKLICSALFSWVNAGSHIVNEDLYISTGDTSIETYCEVFKAVFEKAGHLPHYEMMMRQAHVDEPASAPA